MIKAILFDLDDTIFDHRHAVLESLKDVQKEFQCFRKYSLEEFEAMHRFMLNSQIDVDDEDK